MSDRHASINISIPFFYLPRDLADPIEPVYGTYDGSWPDSPILTTTKSPTRRTAAVPGRLPSKLI
jgi:hypothetical protein